MPRWLAIIGGVVLLAGFAMIPLPGPGWPVVYLGLLILAAAAIAGIVSRRTQQNS